MATRARRRWVEVATNSQLPNRRHHLVIVIPVLRHLQGVCGELIRHVVHWQAGAEEMATRGSFLHLLTTRQLAREPINIHQARHNSNLSPTSSILPQI